MDYPLIWSLQTTGVTWPRSLKPSKWFQARGRMPTVFTCLGRYLTEAEDVIRRKGMLKNWDEILVSALFKKVVMTSPEADSLCIPNGS